MPKLSGKHAKELGASAIGDEQIANRGYKTVGKNKKLRELELGFSSVQLRAPGLLIPSYDAAGNVTTYQFKPDKPRLGDNEKPVKYETPRGSRTRVDCPPGLGLRLKDADEPLWITEGVKKADSAVSAGLCCVALTGVWNWRGTRADGKSGPLEDWDSIELTGRKTYIAYDSDVMVNEGVQAALHDLTRFLSLRGAVVWWVILPRSATLAGEPSKTGLDDFFADNGTVEELLGYAVAPERSVRVDGKELRDLTRDALAVLASANQPEPSLFQRDSALAEANGQGITKVSKDRMRHLLGEAADWYNLRKVKDKVVRKAINPPFDVISNVLVAHELWQPFPALERVVTTPVFAADGTLRTQPGYHPSSRSLYLPPAGLVIPDVSPAPSKTEVKEAKRLIKELFQDFVFVGDSDRAHAWALLLQPFARELIRGFTPMYSTQAPKQGTGKTLLVRSALAASVGYVDSISAPHGDDEMRKTLGATFMAAAPVLFIDNLDRQLNYPSLASALTSPIWTGRVLGKSENSSNVINCTFVLTGNNPRFSADMERRVVKIRLDTLLEDPSKREGFKLSLPGWALENRGRLVWAACTLISSWIDKGRPGPGKAVPSLGSYGAWRRVIGGILEAHGVPGFLETPEEEEQDISPERETLEAILEAVVTSDSKFNEHSWFMAKDLALHLFTNEVETPMVSGNTKEQYAQSLGTFLGYRKGQVINGYRLERNTNRSRGGYAWRFAVLDEG
ncbi:DUF3854 domain-containing protein [Kribbella sp. NPDC051770]|uniref:DUF3854 domain-containing protein n=1 Tax=Kribbella sp. NPDC051770 TaxID=3155413 RepID=UPI003419C278